MAGQKQLRNESPLQAALVSGRCLFAHAASLVELGLLFFSESKDL